MWVERGKVVYLDDEGQEIEFATFDWAEHRLPVGSEVYEPITRQTLRSHSQGKYSITTHDGLRRDFEGRLRSTIRHSLR